MHWGYCLAMGIAALALLALPGPVWAQSSTVILSTTTSTQDSGLLDVLVPMFEKKTGLSVKTISVGTGQALALAGRGRRFVMQDQPVDAAGCVEAMQFHPGSPFSLKYQLA